MNFLEKIFSPVVSVDPKDLDRVALIEDTKSYSYADISRSLQSSIALLQNQKLKKGDTVGVFVNNSAGSVAGILSCAFLGITYLPVSTSDPDARLQQKFQSTKVKALLFEPADQQTATRFAQSLQVPALEIGLRPDGDLLSLSGMVREDFVLYRMFTSGSTGTPKGVSIRASQIDRFCQWAIQNFSLLATDRFLGLTPFTFDLSVYHLFIPFQLGACVHLARKKSSQVYPGEIFRQGITTALMVPSVAQFMLEAEEVKSFPQLRSLLFCGEKLMARHVGPWQEQNPQLSICNLYGPVEATVACSSYWLPKAVQDPISIGKPILDTQFHIEPQDGDPTRGELIISGSCISEEGYGEASQSEKFFVNAEGQRSYRTGDLVSREESGDFLWLGRLDHQVKILGHRVDLTEIESLVQSHPDVSQCLCHYDEPKKKLFCLITIRKDAEPRQLIETLQAKIKQDLPAYMVPGQILAVEKFELNNHGKLDRRMSLLRNGIIAEQERPR